MQCTKHKNSDGKITGYRLCLSARDTTVWATRPNRNWPCSTLRGSRFTVSVDQNGVYDLTVNGRDAGDIDGNELDAIVADHLPADCQHLWPVWKAAVAS